ncbi:MAG TPA: hypothetical protein VE130_04725 [Nitrososphaeraceae archaeon]|nr:hypothetical protein [Nitrososphaeraceae archaeon]
MITSITAMVTISANSFAASANAKANLDHANPAVHAANSNQGYMEDCKKENSARDCATGPDNNGEFTSNVAHGVNGPDDDDD